VYGFTWDFLFVMLGTSDYTPATSVEAVFFILRILRPRASPAAAVRVQPDAVKRAPVGVGNP
jgi:hypothetical protein